MSGTGRAHATAVGGPEAGLRQSRTVVAVDTGGPGMREITAEAARWLGEIGAGEGLLTVFIRHTSASLTIQENADPDVQRDLVDAMSRLAPEEAPYRHRTEGPDDMPAHVKSMLSATSLSIPVADGRMALGTWQGLFLIEHRARARRRQVVLHYLGT